MITDNYLLAFNGLVFLWLLASGIGFAFLYKCRKERPYWWLWVLTGLFSLGPIIILVANHSYPLNGDSILLRLIVLLIVFTLTSLYFHTLDLLNVKVTPLKIICFFGAGFLLAIPQAPLHGELTKYGAAIRTIAFHGSCVILVVLSV